ncbi:cell wall hydrolase/autolysin [Stanieria cyanosphaera PCC 7437]|uniref:Cell wall hydrolase/autolysin n=1 Tax=Stanieria cyanosphaera (strain ATCC 29371 / PCC 7437) TaxID=111780 RepID=K9XQ56_STAC7|nr:N-acetylmuramoyl-L-alanine amidase [Stanieria cyanosphaera]AFZ34229.1 cell wall hydrolase/autolysin [Stanieria cyanosphaera PCC 7437]
MRFHWLALSCLSIFLFCSPAKAGKLLSWEFEADENHLVFITDEAIQPKAQLLANPSRLVIDLPSTSLGSKTVKEEYSGTIRSLRVGQFDQNTTRIVIELAPGYTIDPQEVKFRGLSATQWTVDFPSPRIEPLSRVSRLSSQGQSIEVPSVALSTIPASTSSTATRRVTSVTDTSSTATRQVTSVTDSSYVTATRNGFFIGIDGNRNYDIQKSRDRDAINFDLEGIILPQDLSDQAVAVNQYGVSAIEFTQTSTSPPQARISLKVGEDSSDWLATFSRIRGLIIVPRAGVSSAIGSSEKIPTTLSVGKTTIDAVELTDGDSQLLISANQNVTARTQQTSNGIYEIRIDNAELAEPFDGPLLQTDSPVSELVVRQESSGVVILVTTRLGIRLGEINQPENNLVALPIQRGLAPPPPNDAPLFPPEQTITTINVPQPERTITPTLQARPLPTAPIAHDKPLVVIDAGHGGQDPGTIGIGSLQEKHIVLPISLEVAEILKEQGVEVKLTRDSDYFVSLQGRTDYANKIKADLFVSIHANAINLSRPDVNGLETYYYENGRRLAEVIHWSILNSVNISDRGIRRARFYVLRHSAMPAVLVEVGFVTGAIDAPRLRDPNHRSQMAQAIARGIIEYLKQNKL